MLALGGNDWYEWRLNLMDIDAIMQQVIDRGDHVVGETTFQVSQNQARKPTIISGCWFVVVCLNHLLKVVDQ